MTPADATLITIAISAASHAFGPKLDRLGKPMILHSLRVGLAGQTPDEMIVGFLHDVVEDTDETLEDLGSVWPDHIVAAVDALSRRSSETYSDFIERVRAAGALAIAVKLHDIADNVARAFELPTAEARSLRNRWQQAEWYLQTGAWNPRLPPGSESQT